MRSLDSPPFRRAALIYNPVARTLARHPRLVRRAAESLAQQNVDCRLIQTLAPGSATDQVKEEIAGGCDFIVAAGGDGTINEIAEGMLFTGVPLAVLPCGTANVLARELGLPPSMESAAAAISRYQVQTISVGSLRGGALTQRSFLCMMGVGLDADIISRLNLDLKAAAGKLAYYICGFSQVARILPEFDVEVDGQRHRASFALVSRVRNYGGDLEIARNASLLRNDFEVILFKGNLAFRYLPYLLGVALKRVHRMPGVEVLRAQTVKCHSVGGKKVYVQIDGELVGEAPVEAESVTGALNLLVPPEFVSREKIVAAVSAYA